MADIQSKIMSKYGIDIAQENILKLYKIESANVSDSDLQEKIDLTRKRWNQSINGANEKNAERDRARLEKADIYETILRNAKTRKELYSFYNDGESQKQRQVGDTTTGIEFARKYFQLIETSKKINRKDVEFFFNYFQSERKNKKGILEMLEREFKITGLMPDEKKIDEGADVNPEGETKDEASPFIVNLFQEATVIKLRKIAEFYEKATQSNDVCQKYPKIREGLYEFLEMNKITDMGMYNEYISDKSKEIYAVRQERGNEFIPLVDMFNTLQVLGTYRDVVDNIEEFKLLIRYPSLTPYMFSIVEMKPKTIKGLINLAKIEYSFRDDTDFILNYYNIMQDNFGITNIGIGSIIKKAEKNAKKNKVLNDIDEKLGRNKKRSIPIGARIIHILVYWPIFLVYLVFEIFKSIFTELNKLAYPVFALVFIGLSWLLPKFGIENILILRKLFIKAEWYSVLENIFSQPVSNGYEAFFVSCLIVVGLFIIYAFPSYIVATFIKRMSEIINKQYDWMGYERTFQNIFQHLRNKTEEQYLTQRKWFFKTRIPKIIINVVCMIVIILIVHFAPLLFKSIIEKTGYFQ